LAIAALKKELETILGNEVTYNEGHFTPVVEVAPKEKEESEPTIPLDLKESLTEVMFFPDTEDFINVHRICHYLSSARKTLEICVFTITDDRFSKVLLDAHKKGVEVRIITDDEKSIDPGSDIEAFLKAGIKLRMDCSHAHMHHKFAILDGLIIMNGSFNWTRSASKENRENVMVSNDKAFVAQFQKEFEHLWQEFAKNPLTPVEHHPEQHQDHHQEHHH